MLVYCDVQHKGVRLFARPHLFGANNVGSQLLWDQE